MPPGTAPHVVFSTQIFGPRRLEGAVRQRPRPSVRRRTYPSRRRAETHTVSTLTSACLSLTSSATAIGLPGMRFPCAMRVGGRRLKHPVRVQRMRLEA